MSGRLTAQSGEWIDRDTIVPFRFEGRSFEGFAGDTISSALWASGVRVLGRSFKYHRPRGIYSMAGHDANVIVDSESDINIRADRTPIDEGMDLFAVNTIGGVDKDRGGLVDRFSRFLPVGFYYKAFHGKRFLFWERRIRDMAGLGRISFDRAHRKTPKCNAVCDVLIIGAGPAGLSAAIACADEGQDVVLVDENPQLGGSLGYRHCHDPAAREQLEAMLKQVGSHPRIQVRTRTTAAAYFSDHWIPLIDDTCMTRMRARAVVVCSGSIDQPAVFQHNDLPGIMLAGAALRLIRRFAVKPFDLGVVLAANRQGYQAALDLHAAGVGVAAIVDPRPEGESSALAGAVRTAEIDVRVGKTIERAVPSRGLRGIRAVVLCDAEDATRSSATETLDCDGVAMSVGWAPADDLIRQGGGRMRYDVDVEQYVPGALPRGVFSAGSVNGIYSLEQTIADGRYAALSAAKFLGQEVVPGPALREPGPAPSHPYPVSPSAAGKAFIDLDEDLQQKDIVHAMQEGYDHVELLKRYSSLGMGPSQGKLSNMNAVRVLGRIKGEGVAGTGRTTARPYVHPVSLEYLAGRGFDPERQTPVHAWHVKHGAQFMPAGQWLRPAYYGDTDSKQRSIREEVMAVRESAGLVDVGTLGKIDLFGPDALRFIEMMYTGRFEDMAEGRMRYGLMCDESGAVIDDGLITRIGPQRYYLTTTSSGAEAIYRMFKRWIIIFGLDVCLANVTHQYGAMNLAGPRSRDILEQCTALDLSGDAMPYMAIRETQVAGAPARIMRVGFVGELGYELHVPAGDAAHVWEALMEAGKDASIRPFGVEAQRVLRLEKGHLIVGQDTDSLTNPFEASAGRSVKMDKLFFVGQRSLAILEKRPLRRRLVGFGLVDEGVQMPRENHLVIENGDIKGRVTSVAGSPAMGRVIGLAHVSPEQAAPGSRFQIRVENRRGLTAEVIKIPFYDPENRRQKTPES